VFPDGRVPVWPPCHSAGFLLFCSSGPILAFGARRDGSLGIAHFKESRGCSAAL
jgi:hypothetical protein